ncbi:MAG: hypothetical protein Q9183_000691 [Haloplaca sp. 2 TL-2023]
MPNMNFAFGIGNYFRFTFSFQLGAPRAINVEPLKQQDSIASLSTPSNIVTDSTPGIGSTAIQSSIGDADQQIPYQSTPEDQLIPSLEDQFDSQRESAPDGLSHVDLPIEDDTSSLLVSPAIAPATRRRNLCTPSIGSTPVGQSTTLPQTPPSTGRPAGLHANRSKSQTNKHSNLHVSQYKTKYLQLRTRGPRVKLPSLKSYKKHLPTPPPSNVSSTPSKRPLTFLSLPLEIRNMVYRELLVSATAIKKPHKLVWNQKSIMVNSLHSVKDIDSAILRVCRTIYDEALPVLYGQNTFEFCKARKLRDFSHGILGGRITKFALRPSETGRFTLIRSIILRLGYDRKPYVWQNATTQAPDRKKIWSHWYEYFFNRGDPREYSWSMHLCMQNDFPALDKLVLDFSDWQLGPTDAIRVSGLRRIQVLRRAETTIEYRKN